MGLLLKKLIRSIIWKIIGEDPRREVDIDLISPRRQMIDYAVAIINHYTRLTRRNKEIGQRDSLLRDYLEFGCYRGDTLIYAFKRAASLMPWMRFFAFDSFQGFPQLDFPDTEGEYWQGQFSCTQDEFLNNLKKANVKLNRVRCIPGWFSQTLTPELKRKEDLNIASIVYIDCNLYKSCIPVLQFITDILETGSVIMFDDWFSFKGNPEKGIQRACKEWLLRNPQILLQDWHMFGAYGKSFIVKIK